MHTDLDLSGIVICSGVLWAYRNTPNESTREKPSLFLYGMDLRTLTEAAFLPSSTWIPAEVSDYRDELILSLTSSRMTAEDPQDDGPSDST